MKPNTKCHTCSAGLYKSPSKRGKFIKNYCNMQCQRNNRIMWIGFLVANYQTMGVKQLCAYISLPRPTLHTWVHFINEMLEGYCHISFPKGPEKQPHKPKAERVITPKPPTAVKAKPMKKPKPKKEKITSSNHGKPEKKERQLVIKAPPIGTPGYQLVRINSKTFVHKKIAV